MKIGIIVAMDKELSLLTPLIKSMSTTSINDTVFYTGRIANHQVVALKCGIGKVNAAIRTLTLIENFHPRLVINTGVAGGTGHGAGVLDVVLASEVAYHDVWCGPGTKWGHMDGLPERFAMDAAVVESCRNSVIPDVRLGLICSGDRFISKVEEVDFIKEIYPDALACDMESASIAHACHDCGVPFAVVRVVSDTPGQADNISQYKNFWNEAPEKTFNSVKSIIEKLK